MSSTTVPVDRDRLTSLVETERSTYAASHPRSAELYAEAEHLFGRVPMTWMNMWSGGFPLYLDRAWGNRVVDVDGHEYVDFALGDTGAMAGHSPRATVEAVTRRLSGTGGITTMLPTADAEWVGAELTRRFRLPLWSFTLTATDANRWAIRIARMVTGRPKILTFAYCYHGSVDEAFAVPGPDGEAVDRPGLVGAPVPLAETTRVAEFNDLAGVEEQLRHGDVAAILTEPALTNIGIVLPEPGYHDALRRVTREHGTFLVIDETHTICAGPGGATRAWGLEPDFLTIGKPLASGVPAACYGMSADAAERAQTYLDSLPTTDVGGIGGTLSGNALSLAAMKATLEHVLTEEAFERMIALGARWADGVRAAIDAHDLPWEVQRLGCRAEYWFTPTPPRNGGQAAASEDHDLMRFTHLYALNRGVLLTPFHNMALISPATTEADVDAHTAVFDEMAAELAG